MKRLQQDKRYTNKRNGKIKIFVNKNNRKRDQVHGFKNAIPDINSKKGLVYNFLWFLVISFSALTCMYQTYDRISFYLSRPTDTRVSLIRNSSVKFPSVTVCAGNQNHQPLVDLRRQKATETGKADFCEVHPFSLINDSFDISTFWEHMSITGTLISVGVHKESEFVRAVPYGAFAAEPPLVGNTKTVLGTCHTSAFQDLVRFEKADHAKKFEFGTHLALCDTNSIGLFMLHNDDDIVTYKVSREGKAQKPLFKVTYGLSAKRFKVLNKTRRPCDTKKVVSECERNCFEATLRKNKQCRLPLTTPSEVPLCKNLQDTLDAYNALLKSVISFDYSEKCKCPKICDEVLYADHFKMIEKSDEKSLLYIYFADDVIEVVEENNLYGFISLMCDVGGNLGLFLGLSIPAMFQLGESMVVYSLKKMHSKSNDVTSLVKYRTASNKRQDINFY